MLQYTKRILNEGLAYTPSKEVGMWGYSDASYGNDDKTKRGRSGFVSITGGAIVN